jgi:hypothetical protein
VLLAGGRQILQPKFTAKEIFDIAGNGTLPIIRELGVSNLATGVVGIASLAIASFTGLRDSNTFGGARERAMKTSP